MTLVPEGAPAEFREAIRPSERGPCSGDEGQKSWHFDIVQPSTGRSQGSSTTRGSGTAKAEPRDVQDALEHRGAEGERKVVPKHESDAGAPRSNQPDVVQACESGDVVGQDQDGSGEARRGTLQ
ncbi:hypothetical protein MTO96_004004 [Rhipicephalus appendiculatus]